MQRTPCTAQLPLLFPNMLKCRQRLLACRRPLNYKDTALFFVLLIGLVINDV
jgi:hypothetical protein